MITLTREKETMLITLFAKANESKEPDSLLQDRFAARAVEQIDYDFSRLAVTRDMGLGLAIRAKRMDDWVRGFIAEHPNATVLHLGCGLDTRVMRVAPPETVRWFDVDYPEVIALRTELYGAREDDIASSVTELSWLDRVPRDRPTIIVAEGLTMYLERDDLQRMLVAITEHLPSGELDIDAFSRRGVRMMQKHPSVKATGAVLQWGTDDPHELERLVPRLRFVEEVPAYAREYLGRFPFKTRLAVRLMLVIPALRRLGRFLRYSF
jgi:O-methyltransferase involved in polyketide biosynthesis